MSIQTLTDMVQTIKSPIPTLGCTHSSSASPTLRCPNIVYLQIWAPGPQLPKATITEHGIFLPVLAVPLTGTNFHVALGSTSYSHRHSVEVHVQPSPKTIKRATISHISRR